MKIAAVKAVPYVAWSSPHPLSFRPPPRTALLLCLGLVIFGSGIYLMAHLGAGPRDGLMTGLQRLSGLPIAWVRTAIEVTVVVIGWLLGGTVGIGTLLFALLIGPAVALGLALVESLSEPAAGDPT